jgi:TatD related DNase
VNCDAFPRRAVFDAASGRFAGILLFRQRATIGPRREAQALQKTGATGVDPGLYTPRDRDPAVSPVLARERGRHERPGSPQLQREVFERIMALPEIGEKLLTVHSRGAEKETIELLAATGATAVLRWHSGPQVVRAPFSSAFSASARVASPPAAASTSRAPRSGGTPAAADRPRPSPSA